MRLLGAGLPSPNGFAPAFIEPILETIQERRSLRDVLRSVTEDPHVLGLGLRHGFRSRLLRQYVQFTGKAFVVSLQTEIYEVVKEGLLLVTNWGSPNEPR